MKIERSVFIKASEETVWELLSTQEGMRQWIDPEMEIEMRIGGSHRHRNKEANQWISGTVLEMIPRKKISISWFEDDSDWVHPTKVTFLMEPAPDGVLVTAVHEGFDQIGKPSWESTCKAYEQGWDRHRLLPNLKEVAESRNANR